MDIILYHNPRCSKSRQTLALIKEKGLAVREILYLENPPSQQELDSLLRGLNMEPQDLMRKGEAEYKELDLKNSTLEREQLISIMIEHPKLIERPIVVAGDKVIIGRPPENVLEIL